jgi:hypothetical protein
MIHDKIDDKIYCKNDQDFLKMNDQDFPQDLLYDS